MLLGQVATAMGGCHKIIETVTRIFRQRLFHPNSNLDGYIVVELGKIAAKTGVSLLVVCTGVSGLYVLE